MKIVRFGASQTVALKTQSTRKWRQTLWSAFEQSTGRNSA